MKRRKLFQLTSAGLMGAMVSHSLLSKSSLAQSSKVKIEWLGHTCFLFKSDGVEILVNPFFNIGCTENYRPVRENVDLVLISSLLLDEGSPQDLKGDPELLSDAGVYEFRNIRLQGIAIPHDRFGGRRFGTNVAWRWTMGGVRILHLGGAADDISFEQQILMGSPDLLFIPVGGGPKAYNPQQAKSAIEVLKPKVVIPTQYLTSAANLSECDLVSVDEFLKIRGEMTVERIDSNKFTFTPSQIPSEGTIIKVLNYNNIIQNS